MAGLRRTEHVSLLVHHDRSVSLVEKAWTFRLGRENVAGGFSYRAPASVAMEGQPPVAIRDHVMLTRLGAVAVTGLLVLRAIVARKTTDPREEKR